MALRLESNRRLLVLEGLDVGIRRNFTVEYSLYRKKHGPFLALRVSTSPIYHIPAHSIKFTLVSLLFDSDSHQKVRLIQQILFSKADSDLRQLGSSQYTHHPTMPFFKITLIRSAIGLPKKTSGVLQALGLRKRMATVFHPVSPQVAGQIMAVKELVAVSEVEKALTKADLKAARKPNPGYYIETPGEESSEEHI